eukprot:scaffold4629_cov146-Skeletonema_menzelii.AAC.6
MIERKTREKENGSRVRSGRTSETRSGRKNKRNTIEFVVFEDDAQHTSNRHKCKLNRLNNGLLLFCDAATKPPSSMAMAMCIAGGESR